LIPIWRCDIDDTGFHHNNHFGRSSRVSYSGQGFHHPRLHLGVNGLPCHIFLSLFVSLGTELEAAVDLEALGVAALAGI
jgi:hypothetical protein